MSLDQKPKNLELKKPKKLDLQDYEMLKVLGEGSFGRVKLTKNLKTGTYCAFKQLKKYDIVKFKQVDHLKNEMKKIVIESEHRLYVAHVEEKKVMEGRIQKLEIDIEEINSDMKAMKQILIRMEGRLMKDSENEPPPE